MFFQHLFSAGIGLTIFIIALILGKKNRSISDYVLVVWLVIFALSLVSIFVLNSNQKEFEFYEFLIFEFTEASIFLHGPILYFYTLSLTDFSFKLSPKQIVHFVPFFVAFVFLVLLLSEGGQKGNPYRNLLLIGKMTSLLVYTIISLKLLHFHKINVEDIFSNTERKYLTWLSVIGWGILSIWTIAVFSLIFDRFTNLQIPQYGGVFTNISLCLLIFIMGYFGVKQPSLFVDYNEKTIPSAKQNITSKYSKSGLSLKDAIRVHRTTVEYMERHKPFLDPELTLYSLAGKLHVKPNHLSQAINSVEKKNFFNFINHYRIEEVKKNLRQKSKANLTLLGLAFECGFNSKVSFNRTFKKIVGETPSEFKKRFD